MPIRKIRLEKNTFYHVYNRALDKKIIFKKDIDFKKFITFLKRIHKKFKGIKIYAYAILPNHFHFLISSNKSGKEISIFMAQVQQSYAMYFKSKHKNDFRSKTGVSLFQGRFRAKFVRNEKYLNQVVKYINLNPIKHKLVDKIEDYKYSSYNFWIYDLDKLGIKLDSIPE